MSNKHLFIFLGPPGAGKGTLSRLCVDELGLEQLSTGDLLRKHISEKTPIGQKMDFVIKAGKLIPDEMIIELVAQWLKQRTAEAPGIILDGFPRTPLQAGALHKIVQDALPEYNISVVRLSLSSDVIVERLLSRAVCTNKDCQAVYSQIPDSCTAPKLPNQCDECCSDLDMRDDDTLPTVKERINTYKKHEQELVNFFCSRDILVREVNVERPLDEVFKEFKKLSGLEMSVH